jgi:hypothetical protein
VAENAEQTKTLVETAPAGPFSFNGLLVKME